MAEQPHSQMANFIWSICNLLRRFYDEQEESWYFSVIDIVGALTDSVNPGDYWFKMKIRVKFEDGLELSTTEISLSHQYHS